MYLHVRQVFLDDVEEARCIHDKEDRPKTDALGYSTAEVKVTGLMLIYENTFFPTGEERGKPAKCVVGAPKVIVQTLRHYTVINGVKSRT